MPLGPVTPRRTFAEFGGEVRDFEKSDEVLDVLTAIVTDLDQNIGAYIGGPFIALWLRDGEQQAADESDLDLLFVNQIDGYIDIILRQRAGMPVDGGSLNPSATITVTDEVIEGYRVLIGIDENGVETRYEFLGGRYFPINPVAVSSRASTARRRRM